MDKQPRTGDRGLPDGRARPLPPGGQPGAVSRYIGGRLISWGRGLQFIGLLVLGVAGVKTYLAYSRHDHPAALITGVVGGAVALALAAVGENMRRSGASYLRGEKHLARSVGRLVARRRATRQPPR